MEKTNALKHPEVFYCRHMYAGLAGYEDETILVDLDAMRKLGETFEGKPLYVFHQDVDIETIEQADGWVSDCWYNEADGWLWAKFVAVTDAARDAIEKGWSVSNAYMPTEWGAGGTYTNLEYNRKIVDGYYTHLAIVPNPRYEAAAIFSKADYDAYIKQIKKVELTNAKKGKAMLKLFKNEKKEVTSLDSLDGISVELENGKNVSIEEMINAVKNAQEEEKKEKVNMDMEIEVGDETMPLKELVNKYKNMCKKNAGEGVEEDTDKVNESDEDEEDKEKSNESEEDKEEEKENSKHFEELKNASKHGAAITPPRLAMIDGLAAGKERF